MTDHKQIKKKKETYANNKVNSKTNTSQQSTVEKLYKSFLDDMEEWNKLTEQEKNMFNVNTSLPFQSNFGTH